MPAPVSGPKAPKKAVNLSIDSGLLRQARAMKINLSRTLEEKLEQLVREERARRWPQDNREAIEAHNRYGGQHGVFSDRLRKF